MLPPEIIERLRRKKEERDRPALRLPLYQPELTHPEENKRDNEELTERIVIIDLI